MRVNHFCEIFKSNASYFIIIVSRRHVSDRCFDGMAVEVEHFHE